MEDITTARLSLAVVTAPVVVAAYWGLQQLSFFEQARHVKRSPIMAVTVFVATFVLHFVCPQSDEDNWTAPFSTKDYDATTCLRCRAAGDREFGSCPAGIWDAGDLAAWVRERAVERFSHWLSDGSSPYWFAPS